MFIRYFDQITKVTEEFKIAVSKTIADYFPGEREIRDVQGFLENHLEAVQSGLDLKLEDCLVQAESNPTDIVFTIDAPGRGTGFALVKFPLLEKGGQLVIEGYAA